ncbi:hypothetical protein N4G70_29275 [Streptomyces sp. ASQP_92]|uniref:hypothetical protein n=1 Tax=Streptomyces sp. ASQP_92 TaxID=2979116 RepID=UPI0021BF8894|nr:hypothetical protein [Streptomyces sp. ASQP_92]MCT9092933.1 hypothetical protein [Streptomyces sp. ASQP_92]
MSISTTPEFKRLVMAMDHDVPADAASYLLAAFYEVVRTEVRAEVAADIRRAELPSFPAGERTDLVAKTMRAVDVRIAEWGAEAPYGVTEQAIAARVAAAEAEQLKVCPSRAEVLREAIAQLSGLAGSVSESRQLGLDFAVGVLLDMVTGRDKTTGGAS